MSNVCNVVKYPESNSELLYLYGIPVAGFSNNSYFQTSQKLSKRFTKHINEYLMGQKALKLDDQKVEDLAYLIAIDINSIPCA